jgi:predicted phage-related endonuclease
LLETSLETSVDKGPGAQLGPAWLNDVQCLYPASEAEWRQLRRPRINSTESAALFGFSPYQTAYELGVEKRLGVDRGVENERTKWGQRLQGVIADAFEEEYGVRVERADHRYFAMDTARVGASVDYIIKDTLADTAVAQNFDRLGPGVLEIKNVDKWVYAGEWQDGPPVHIEMQLQHQLAVTELKWGCIFALIGGNEPVLVVREFDPKVAERIVGRINSFWQAFEAGELPDPMMPADAKAMCELFGTATSGKVYDAAGDEALGKLAAAYHKLRKTATEADAESDATKARILEHIGDNERVANLKGFNLSATMVPGAHIEYDRKPYRSFRLTEAKRRK